jgi:Ca-activated chloride channel family protein
MYRVVSTKFFVTLPSMLVLGAFGVCTAFAEQVKVDVELGTPVMLAGTKQKAYLRVAMTGATIKDTVNHPQVNVAFVIDKSGSMQGEKIVRAKEAVRMAIAKLRDHDIASVVAYDTNVQVIVPATRLSDRPSVNAAIDSITANNSTALFAGVSKGAAELRKFFDKNQVNRIVLLSDGLANVGPSSPGELGELGASLGREGITVTTIGLGLDYNEDLMVKLAQKSDGNHMFAENATDLEKAFATEFGDLLTVVAQDVNIKIPCTAGVRPIRVLGREAEIAGQDVMLTLNQLYAGQTKYMILEVEVPSATVQETWNIGNVEVSYLDMVSKDRIALARTAVATFTDSPAIVESKTNNDVMSSAIYQIGVEQNILATRLRDEGKVEEARALLNMNCEFLTENGKRLNNETLKEYGQSNELSALKLNEGDWTYRRKQLREEQFQILNQQRAQ